MRLHDATNGHDSFKAEPEPFDVAAWLAQSYPVGRVAEEAPSAPFDIAAWLTQTRRLELAPDAHLTGGPGPISVSRHVPEPISSRPPPVPRPRFFELLARSMFPVAVFVGMAALPLSGVYLWSEILQGAQARSHVARSQPIELRATAQLTHLVRAVLEQPSLEASDAPQPRLVAWAEPRLARGLTQVVTAAERSAASVSLQIDSSLDATVAGRIKIIDMPVGVRLIGAKQLDETSWEPDEDAAPGLVLEMSDAAPSEFVFGVEFYDDQGYLVDVYRKRIQVEPAVERPAVVTAARKPAPVKPKPVVEKPNRSVDEGWTSTLSMPSTVAAPVLASISAATVPSLPPRPVTSAPPPATADKRPEKPAERAAPERAVSKPAPVREDRPVAKPIVSAPAPKPASAPEAMVKKASAAPAPVPKPVASGVTVVVSKKRAPDLPSKPADTPKTRPFEEPSRLSDAPVGKQSKLWAPRPSWAAQSEIER